MEEGMKYDTNHLQALGECLHVCSKYDLEPRNVARLMLDLVASNTNQAQVPVGFLDVPEASDDELDEPARQKPAPKQPEGGRDDKGRKVIRRDHNWRANTLAHLPPGEKRTVAELMRAVGNVSQGAMVARVRVLENEGVIEEVNDGVGGLWRLK